MPNPYFLIVENTVKANTAHDPMTGRFTFGGGSAVRDREEARQRHESHTAQGERSERRQPSSGVLILPEQQARQRGESVNEKLNVRDAKQMEMAASETGGSRVFSFSLGDGSDLDRNVKFVTNTNKAGTFQRGALRVEIHNPETQKREIFQRQMSELPKLVAQVLGKGYSTTGQHRRNTNHFVKADSMQWGLTEEQANERGTLRTLLVSKVHHAYTTACDQLSMRGYLSQEQRVKVTAAFGAALKYLNENLDSDVAAIDISDSDLSDIANTMKGMNNRNASAAHSRGARIRQGVSITSDGSGGGTKWITTSGGKRIPIDNQGGGGGKAGQSDEQQGNSTQQDAAQQDTQPQQKPESSLTSEQRDNADELRNAEPDAQTQASETQAASDANDAGAGLTHAQRTMIVSKIAAKMGIDPETVQVSETDREDAQGKVAADYDPATSKITVYPNGFSRGRAELIGTLNHEAMHAKFSKVLDDYNSQQKAFQNGESLTSGKVNTFKELKPVFTSERATYARADGINKYSTMFWQHYQQKPTTQNYTHAINETLAEVSRLTQSSAGGDIHPQMLSLFNRVNQLAGK